MNKNILHFLLSLYDKNTYSHVCRVAILSNEIGKCLELPKNDMNLLLYSSLLHDIGKIFLPTELLEKKEKLSNNEFDLIKKHVELGYLILPSDMDEIKNIILNHHERLDGSGYPFHKTDNEIPKLSKIIAIADSYDAMTSNRYYNNIKTHDEAFYDLFSNTSYYGENKYEYYYVKIFKKCFKKINAYQQLSIK